MIFRNIFRNKEENGKSYKPGTILVSQSLIINGATAIDDDHIDAGFLIDLAAFIEAIVLNDKLLTIKSSMIPSRILQMPTRKKLINLGILEEVSEHGLADQKGQTAIIKQLITNKVHENDEIFSEWLVRTFNEFSQDSNHFLLDKRPLLDTQRLMKYMQQFHDSPDFRSYVSSMIDQWLHHSPWPFWQQAFHLRTIMYLALSKQLSVPLSPDLTRSKLLQHYSLNLNNNMLQKAYQHVADCISASVEELKAWNSPFNVAIPPLFAIALSRSEKPGDLLTVTLDIREEYDSLRRTFREYESGIEQAQTLREAREHQEFLKNVRNEISRDHDVVHMRGFVETLEYAETAIDAAVDYTDPAAYSSKLVSKPVEWIRRWWTRRKAHQLFRLQKKVNHLKNYSKLIEGVFGYVIQDDPWKVLAEWKD